MRESVVTERIDPFVVDTAAWFAAHTVAHTVFWRWYYWCEMWFNIGAFAMRRLERAP